MGRVKSALAATRSSRRDDADFFFAMSFLACVNYQQERDTASETDGMPALFILNRAIRYETALGSQRSAPLVQT
jgi:hypothetical protein